MPTRRRTVARKPKADSTRRRRLVSAATMLPLALGLAANMSPGASSPAKREVSRKLPACTLPFDSIEQHHPIDDTCGAAGKATKVPQIQQNRMKNNFCATGTPINIDFETLRQLQKDVEDRGISFGSDGAIPEDRGPLQHLPTNKGEIGEGMVVRLAAFVVDAHPSNVGKGESVNCGKGGKENNDIHIVLDETSPTKGNECASVTAEISPHFRPDVWAPDILNDHNTHMFRFTGQLFFDASHKPCANGKGSPKRSSVWEVHPVYRVDMCMDPANNCKVDSEANWLSLEQAIDADSTETRLWLPDEISRDLARARDAPWHLK